jgi:hypothetical protein
MRRPKQLYGPRGMSVRDGASPILSYRIDKDIFVGHLRRRLHVEPARLKERRVGEKEELIKSPHSTAIYFK